MKIEIQIDEQLTEDEIIIKTPALSPQISRIHTAISEAVNSEQRLELFDGATVFFVPLREILFFETETNSICAHTKTEIYRCKQKLYELENILPMSFMRVSKSTIINTQRIYSVTHSVSTLVQFAGSHKQAYVSRNYYKALKDKLNEKR